MTLAGHRLRKNPRINLNCLTFVANVITVNFILAGYVMEMMTVVTTQTKRIVNQPPAQELAPSSTHVQSSSVTMVTACPGCLSAIATMTVGT